MTKLRRYVAGALFGAPTVLLILAADRAHAQAACGPADCGMACLAGTGAGFKLPRNDGDDA